LDRSTRVRLTTNRLYKKAATMLTIDLSETNEDRLHQAMAALQAAAYDPIRMPANWLCDPTKLSPMAYDRLRALTIAAIEAVPGGTDEAAAMAFLKAVSVNRSNLSN
jgi:hypothetical protein